MSETKKLNIALAQIELPAGATEENFQKGEEMAQRASEGGADLLLLPELWVSGYDLKNCDRYASSLDQGWFQRMARLAADNQILLGGSLIEVDQDNYYNTFVLFDRDGSLINSYRKIHLFKLLEEDQYLQSGNQLITAETNWGRMGLTICYDLRFPEIFRSYAVSGSELILIVAEWPQRRVFHWNQLLIARAIENQCFIAGVNKVGESGGEKLGGRSSVINPMGEILVQGGEKEELLIIRVDLTEAQTMRRWMPVLDDRKPDVYLDTPDE
jgi:predicted amidohydrolase